MIAISVVFTVLFVSIERTSKAVMMTAEPINTKPLDWYQKAADKMPTLASSIWRKFKRKRIVKFLRNIIRVISFRTKKRPKRGATSPGKSLYALEGITAYMNKLERHNAVFSNKVDLHDELASLLCEQYGYASTDLNRVNRDKTTYFNFAFGFLVAALILASFSSTSYFYMKRHAYEKVYHVKVINPGS